MNAHRNPRYSLFAMFAAIIMLLSACRPAIVTKPPQPSQASVQLTVTQVIEATQTSTQPTTNGTTGDITLDYSALAQAVTVEIVPALPFDPYLFWTTIGPEYRLLTLDGYPVATHDLKPQIYVYPVDEMASANENMAKVAAELQTLLQTQQAGDKLPFLPLVNEIEAMTAQVQYLDFNSGTGVRYLTQFNQGPVPINNSELMYTFQGLTNDGQYYVAAVLPVTNPVLQADAEFSAEYSQKLSNNPGYYTDYLSSTVNLLNQQPAASFTPNLDELDAMIRSINVPPTETATPTPEIFNPAPIEAVLADKARDDLSTRLGVDVTSISVVETTQQTWPDSCLGLAPAAMQECAKTEVPGWRIVLNAAGHTHEYRANSAGSLLSYSRPVLVAGPEACKLSGTSMIYSPEDGYCFAYPVRFHRTDERGPVAIYGPAYDPGPEPLYAAVTLEISNLPEGQTLDSVANDFIAQLGNVPAPQTRLTQLVDGEPALMLEVVPGMLGSRDLFLIHDGKLFHFTFWPAPTVASETPVDVNDLYRTVTQSFHFLS